MADAVGIQTEREQRIVAAAGGEPVVKQVLKVNYFKKQFPH
jgi:hypothetical protein